MTRRHLALFLGLILGLLAAGCGLPKIPAPEKHYYALNPSRPDHTAPSGATFTLKVRPFDASPGFSGRELVYRLGEHEFESDYYNVYFIPPAPALTQQARQWLRRSGRFAAVVEGAAGLDPDLTLEGSVTTIHGDFRNKQNPLAVLELQIFLVRAKEKDAPLAFQNTYRREIPFAFDGKDPSGLIAGLNTAAADILSELESDLGGVVNGLESGGK